MSNTLFVVQSLSRLLLFVTPWSAKHQAFLSFTISRSLFKFMSIELVMLSNHLILSALFSVCFQSFPASGFFPMSRLFASDGHSIGALATVLPMNIQSCFPLGLTGLIFLEILYKTYLYLIYIFNKIHTFKYRLLSLPSLCFLLVPSVFLLPLSFFLLLDKSSIL